MTTYTLLFILVGLHLGINYYGVRGLVLRSLNRQRLAIAWQMYDNSAALNAPNPSEVAHLERIFDFSDAIYDVHSGSPLGRSSIGSSFSQKVQGPCPPAVFDLFTNDRYVIWFDPSYLFLAGKDDIVLVGPITRLHIFLKDGYTTEDQLRAWIQAVQVCKLVMFARRQKIPAKISALSALKTAHDRVSTQYQDFMKKMRVVGWNTDDSAIMAGSPSSVITNISIEEHFTEDKKTR